MCACSPESQPGLRLHPKQCGQQIKGQILPLLSGETPPGVLLPALSFQLETDLDLLEQIQEGHGDYQGLEAFPKKTGWQVWD